MARAIHKSGQPEIGSPDQTKSGPDREVVDLRQAREKKQKKLSATAVSRAKAVERGLTPELQDHIGKQLRVEYGKLVQEPVPDKILDLLKQLDAEEREGES